MAPESRIKMAELKVLKTRQDNRNEYLVEMLLEILARARAGQIKEGCFIGVGADDDIFKYVRSTHRIELVGAIELMKHSMLIDIENNDATDMGEIPDDPEQRALDNVRPADTSPAL